MNYGKAEIERFFAKPDPSICAFLFFGPDIGLAHERASHIAAIALGPSPDPFQLTELSAKDVVDDPARLSDELNAISMLGGRRVVKVSAALDAKLNENLAKIVAAILPHHDGKDRSFLIIEAGDLPARHALAQIFTEAKSAAAIRCYHETKADIRQFVVSFLKSKGYDATAAALDYLAMHLGDDRGITRSELNKLCLYLGPSKKRVELEDVMAVIGDRSEVVLDDLLMALAEGDLADLGRKFDRCLVESDSIQLLRAASRHFTRLHFLLGRLNQGDNFERAAANLNPPLFWTIRARVERQCHLWDERSLARALSFLVQTEARAMRYYPIAETIVAHALFAVGQRAYRARSSRGH